jgi:hypothetical protein
MPRLIKKLKNNRSVVFDSGKFDDWCVYVEESNGIRKAPFDETYFTDLVQIAQKYKENKVYQDFVCIYENTTSTINQITLTLIDEIVSTYNIEDNVLIEQWFTVIYAGMIAEENKKNAILKKRIKRLGMHQVLIMGMPANQAASFSKGKNWRDLNEIMINLGF